jgi:hypothetical protein
MKNIKKKFNKFIIYFKFLIKKLKHLIKKTLLKHPNKTNNIFNKYKFKFKFKSKVSNFNIYLISIISLLFIYLFYLTIPALYNKSWVQNTIESELLDNFKINFSISSEITYEILPSPHFTIKNVKILNDDLENPKEISDIKKLKIFIYQKNFFKKENMAIKKVLIENANFMIQSTDFSFFNKLFNEKLSEKKIHVKKSNIFFKDVNKKTLSITQLSKLSLFFDSSKLLNKIFLKGEIFKIPFTLNFNKDLINKENNFLIDSNKYKIKLKNKTTNKEKTVNGLNSLSILNLKLITEYEFKENSLSFKSSKSQISNNKVDYNGELNLNPFNLILDINLKKINLKKLFDNSILFEFIKSGKLFHDNLNVVISLQSPNISNNKILDSLKINLNAINGEINFNKSYILSNKIGLLVSQNNQLILDKDNLIFNGNFNLDIKNSDYFFSFFQTSKEYRKPIKNISFNLSFNFLENILNVNNFKIDNKKPSDELVDVLNNFNLNDDQQIGNLIIFKRFVNNIFSTYDG